MIISRRIADPGWRHKNRSARTPGVYGYLPKFHQGRLTYGGYLVYVFPRCGRLVWFYLGRSPRGKRIEWQREYRRTRALRGGAA